MLRIGPDPSNNHVSAINVREDNKRIGIHKNPSGKYIFDISGSLNCKSLYVNDLHYQPGDAMWNVDNSNVSYTSGNVGIGTTSPGTTLDVSGIVQAGDAMISTWSANSIYAAFSHKDKNTQTGYALIQQNNGITYLNSETGRALHLRIANNTKMIIASDGKVGIGTTSPASALHVAGAIDTTPNTGGVHMGMNSGNAVIELCDGASSNTGGTCYIDFTKAAVDRRGRIQYAFSDDSLRFQTATSATDVGSEKMRITSDGNVGIGTTSPTSTLHVGGQTATFETVSQASGIKFIPSSYTLGLEEGEVGTINDNVTFIGNTPITSKDYIDEINAHSDATVITQDHSHFQISAGNSKQRSIIITTGEGIRNIQGWNTQTIASSNTHSPISLQALGGGVGIGTALPSHILDIHSTIETTTNVCHFYSPANSSGISQTKIKLMKGTGYGGSIGGYIEQQVSSGLTFNTFSNSTESEKMRIMHNGNVGIGTTSPSEKLHVNGNVELRNTTANSNCYINMIEGNALNGIRQLYDGTNNAFKIQSADSGTLTTRFTVMRGGNVGIGTTSPSELLDVKGTIFSGNAGNTTNIPGLKIRQRVASTGNDGSDYIQCGEFDDIGNNSSGTDGNKFIVKNNGNVGIRTTSPPAFFSVDQRFLMFTKDNASTSNIGGSNKIEIGDYRDRLSSSTLENFVIQGGDNASQALIFTAGGSYQASIRNIQGWDTLDTRDSANSISLQALGGNVGIGTTTPSEKLQVKGKMFITNGKGKTGSTASNDMLVLQAEPGTGSDYAGCAKIHLRRDDGSSMFGVELLGGLRNATNTGSSPDDLVDVTERFAINTVSGGNKVRALTILGDSTSTSAKVGIGTTSPNDPLEVNGAIRAGNSGFKIGSNVMALFRTSNNVQLDVYDDFIIKTGPVTVGGEPGAVDSMIIKNDGKVGIGTTSPSSSLHVAGERDNTPNTKGIHMGMNSTNDAAIEICAGGTATSNYSYIDFTKENIDRRGRIQYVFADDSFRFQTATNSTNTTSTERMRITSAGNVGIGTDTPVKNLDIIAPTQTTLRVRTSNSATNHLTVPIIMLETLNHQANINLNSNGGGLRFSGDGANNNQMILSPDGYLGIGTTSPSSSLHIAGHSATFETVSQASGIKFIPSSYVNATNLTQNDNVAFIANNPMTNSEYISEINDHSDFQTTATTAGLSHFQLAGGDSKQRSIILSAGRNDPYNFYNIQAWAAQAKIANHLSLQALGGNVGIGMTSPEHLLDVSGNARTQGLTVGLDGTLMIESIDGGLGAGTETVILQTNIDNRSLNDSDRNTYPNPIHHYRLKLCLQPYKGYVGIGTTSPSDKFHVNGVARATSFTSTSDDRVKHNETPLTNSLGLISQLRPKRYLKTQQMYDASLNITIDASGNYTDISENDVVTEEIGIIAQDVLSIDDLSFLVKPSLDPSGNETGPMGLDYQSLFVLSIQAIQEQQTMIQQQQTMIQQLTSRIETIERQQTDS